MRLAVRNRSVTTSSCRANRRNARASSDSTAPTVEGKTASTTFAWVNLMTQLCRDPNIGKLLVPIVPDEGQTFGMPPMYKTFGMCSSVGQTYTPVDKGSLSEYRESKTGQILQEGINEAGSMASFIAAGTAYSTHGVNTIPFYIYYSMFGFQRIGDLAWAAADARARGFLMKRDGRTHHHQRRRLAARRRPQPHCGDDHPDVPRLRPGLRLRTRR